MTNQAATDALESLVSLALRSESPESIDPLATQVAAEMNRLDDPGPPIVLVVKMDVDGQSSVRYVGDPEWAVHTLRAIADSIEAETLL